MGVVLAIAGLNLPAFADLTLSERFLVSAILFASSIPAFRFISRGEAGLPFLPVFGGVYAIHFGLPVFLLDFLGFRGWMFSDHTIERSLLLALSGLILLLLAFCVSLPGSKTALLPRLSLRWNPGKVKLAAPIVGAVGLILTYIRMVIPIPPVLDQIIVFASGLSLVAILMLFILQLQGRLGLPHKLLLWGILLPAQLLLDLSTGAVYQVIKDVIPLILISWGMKRQMPWKAILVGLILLVLLRGNQPQFRTLASAPFTAALSVLERSRLFVEVIADNLASGQLLYAYASTLERTSHLITFADVVEQTPETVPYWHGETYTTLATSLVPRILWPDKPTKTLGQAFGHRYGRLHPGDHTTSENLPQLIELYANFGAPGVLLGMFLIGLIYRALQVMLNHPQAGEGGLLTSAVIFTNLLSIESDFSLVFGSVLQYIVLLYLLMKPLRECGGKRTVAACPGPGRRPLAIRAAVAGRR